MTEVTVLSNLTDKDFEILKFIKIQTEVNGYPPTVREICASVGLSSPATVHARLGKLEDAGFIERSSSKNRSMKILRDPPGMNDMEFMTVPVYGKIAAGVPVTAVEQLEGTFPIPMQYAHNRDVFMLKVSGDSMINAAILDGDYIIVEKQSTASNGDIVVALLDGTDATVKTFYKEKGHFRLQPENDDMEPIITDNLEIIGKVVGVYRIF